MKKKRIGKVGPEIARPSRRMTLTTRLGFFFATAAGAGYSPIAPGTAGSFVAAVAFFYLGRFAWPVHLLAIVLAIVVGLWAAREVERAAGTHDDSRIVIDEVAGMWITLLAFQPTPALILAGFLVFRALDIFKPFPANYIDARWPGARGVIFDDVVCGIYAQLILRAGLRLEALL
ncbi:MAG: phosphatidylglycerophosphatase A [Pseudomonadota bacterium]